MYTTSGYHVSLSEARGKPKHPSTVTNFGLFQKIRRRYWCIVLATTNRSRRIKWRSTVTVATATTVTYYIYVNSSWRLTVQRQTVGSKIENAMHSRHNQGHNTNRVRFLNLVQNSPRQRASARSGLSTQRDRGNGRIKKEEELYHASSIDESHADVGR